MNVMTVVKRLFLIVALLGLLLATNASASVGSTWYVKDSGSSANSCVDWANACDLQTALGLAVSGDQIWVAAGTYKPSVTWPSSSNSRAATFTMKDGVAIYGGFHGDEVSFPATRDFMTNETILSGDIGTAGVATDNVYHVVNTEVLNWGVGDGAGGYVTAVGVTSSAVLDGFTITGGNANGTGMAGFGGGMWLHQGSPTLRNLRFVGNSASQLGGGMYVYPCYDGNSGIQCLQTTPTLADVVFQGNTVTTDGGYGGGGMHVSNYMSSDPSLLAPSLTRVVFDGNTSAHVGGGLVNDGASATLTNVAFKNNTATGSGGGMLSNIGTGGLTVTLMNVDFINNSGHDGGGLYSGIDSTATPSTVSGADVKFMGNQATGYGGGMDASRGQATLVNAVFSGNTAGTLGGGIAVWDYSTTTLTNATFSGNSAPNSGAIFVGNSSLAVVNLQNSVVYGDTGGSEIQANGTANISRSLIQGGCPTGTTCTNVVSGDPKFVNPSSPSGADGIIGTPDDGLRLSAGSPAVDAGDNSYLSAGVNTDVAGQPRFHDDPGTPPNVSSGNGPVDMGAYEFQGTTVQSSDLTVAKNHSGSFTQGQTGATYTITVTNSGSAATSGTVTVTDTLPAGLTATAMSGSGWSCTLGTLTCTRSDALAASASYPAITLTVDVALDAANSVTNSAAVSGGGETDTTNDSANDITSIVAGNHPPTAPSNPSPSSGATGVSVATTLSWTGSTDPDAGDAVTYQIYFDTDSNPSTSVCNGLSVTTCDPTPTGDLAFNTNYYWKVVATDNHGASTTGGPWSFTTATGTPVITVQPTNQMVVVGQTATFTAGATGYDTVKWQMSADRGASWNDVPSATALTFSFPATIDVNGNRYRAVFTNTAGSATTNAVSLTVGKANTATTLGSSANPSTNAVTFTATVSAVLPGRGIPTGTVTFLDGRTVLAPATLNGGVATFSPVSLSAGTHSITAQYGGDASYNASTSAPLSQVVNAPTADVGIDITSGTYNSGSKSITWTLKVTNVGPAIAKAVVVTDNLPKGTKLTGISGLGTGSYGAKGSSVTISLGDVASGSAATVTLTIDTGLSKTPAPGTTFVDTATVSTSSTDNNTANNSDTLSLTIP